MRSYVGITIGPIGDTIGEVTSPAALWYASMIFSDITKRLCETISKRFADVRIYSPYYDKNDEIINKEDGVGKFHDRIFFSSEGLSKDDLDCIIKEIKMKTKERFPKSISNDEDEDFLEQYIQINYIIKQRDEKLTASNCILELSPYLDSLELMKTFPSSDKTNVFDRLFRGENENGNKYIKESGLFNKIDRDKNQFLNKDNNIRTIEDIASHNKTIEDNAKWKHYYAIVYADGDGMGKFLERLSDDNVTFFSKACLKYDNDAASTIAKYGGMSIYAGGDDLLFIAPVIKNQNENIFTLCNDIKARFNALIKKSIEDMDELNNKDEILNKLLPTVSFGISIQYEKHPLYEALESSRKLLYLAKKDGDEECTNPHKDNMLVELKKHSGQSIALLIPNKSFYVFKEFIDLQHKYKLEDAKRLQSVLYTLESFDTLISVLNVKARQDNKIDLEAYQEAFANLFDNEGQNEAKGYIRELSKIYYENYIRQSDERIKISVPGYALKEQPKDKTDNMQALTNMLRMSKFFFEKEGE